MEPTVAAALVRSALARLTAETGEGRDAALDLLLDTYERNMDAARRRIEPLSDAMEPDMREAMRDVLTHTRTAMEDLQDQVYGLLLLSDHLVHELAKARAVPLGQVIFDTGVRFAE
jgi:hypothetical protein